MRVIIISPLRDATTRLRHLLAQLVADVEVTEFDPEHHGRPGAGFDWSLYDMLFIDERLGEDSGLAWLADFARRPGLPPAVLLACRRDDGVAVAAAELPHTTYVERDTLDATELRQLFTRLDVPCTPATPGGALARIAMQGDAAVLRRLAAHADGTPDDGYRFVRLIGQGQHERIYLAEVQHERRPLVVKVLDLRAAEAPDAVQAYAQDVALLAAVDDPEVIRVHQHGFTPGCGYLAVEFFARGDLRQRIQRGLGPAEALAHACAIARALDAIHAGGLVHRDLRPGKVMFRGDGSLALGDFAIARRFGDAWSMSATGSVAGTLGYMSPEQLRGEHVDARADLYALGMLLHEMLTGRRAFHASTPGAMVYQHLYAEVPRLPAPLACVQPVLDRLLAKAPGDRHASAGALLADLVPLAARAGEAQGAARSVAA